VSPVNSGPPRYINIRASGCAARRDAGSVHALKSGTCRKIQRIPGGYQPGAVVPCTPYPKKRMPRRRPTAQCPIAWLQKYVSSQPAASMRVPHGTRARAARATNPRPPSSPPSWIRLPTGIESMNQGRVRERRAIVPLLCQDRCCAAGPKGLHSKPQTAACSRCESRIITDVGQGHGRWL
jgi:hypothetical protein